jgi:hypothetical protein
MRTGFPGLSVRSFSKGSDRLNRGEASRWRSRLPAKAASKLPKIANSLIDPILARRAGINTLLLGSWDEIAGEQFAGCSRPEKIRWPRQDGPRRNRRRVCAGAVLTIACEGARALFMMHQQAELISRVNGFFGFQAICADPDRAKANPCCKTPQAKGAGLSISSEKRPSGRSMLADIEDPRNCARRSNALAPVSSGAAPKQRP